MDVTLVSQSPDFPHLALQLDDQPVFVGRSSHATVQIPHALVSRFHCKFVLEDGRLLVRDLASTNQTIVNGVAVTKCEIEEGDELLIGGVLYVVKAGYYDAPDAHDGDGHGEHAADDESASHHSQDDIAVTF
jgi:predicted component of type VI protein secretion system